MFLRVSFFLLCKLDLLATVSQSAVIYYILKNLPGKYTFKRLCRLLMAEWEFLKKNFSFLYTSLGNKNSSAHGWKPAIAGLREAKLIFYAAERPCTRTRALPWWIRQPVTHTPVHMPKFSALRRSFCRQISRRHCLAKWLYTHANLICEPPYLAKRAALLFCQPHMLSSGIGWRGGILWAHDDIKELWLNIIYAERTCVSNFGCSFVASTLDAGNNEVYEIKLASI